MAYPHPFRAETGLELCTQYKSKDMPAGDQGLRSITSTCSEAAFRACTSSFLRG
jgi:hypothetical protein